MATRKAKAKGKSKPKTAPRLSAYAKAGVDTTKADRFTEIVSKLVGSTLTPSVKKSIGGYAGLYDIEGPHYLAATTDGVGTKLKLAFALKKHDTVGIDLVAMSVNDLICVGARPLFFLDYFATGKLDLAVSTEVLKGIVEGCQQAGCALIGGETAEMPGIYNTGEYDLAGFAVGTVRKESVVGGRGAKPGDVILGLESSGPHSNGFSLIRKLIRPSEKKLLSECLTPTKIYVRGVLELVGLLGQELKGLAHITGSGFLNIPRIDSNVDYEITLPQEYEIPKIFLELKRRGKLSWQELFTTFNMGTGLVAVVAPGAVERAVLKLASKGLDVHRLGVVAPRKGRESAVRVTGPGFKIEVS